VGSESWERRHPACNERRQARRQERRTADEQQIFHISFSISHFSLIFHQATSGDVPGRLAVVKEKTALKWKMKNVK
jgi:hypothetical protein